MALETRVWHTCRKCRKRLKLEKNGIGYLHDGCGGTMLPSETRGKGGTARGLSLFAKIEKPTYAVRQARPKETSGKRIPRKK
jgi:hypothetical protein